MSQNVVATKTQSPDAKSLQASRGSLEAFLGSWRERGQTFASPFGPEAKVSSVQTWQWLPGEMFLVHRLDGNLDENEIACIEVINANNPRGSHAVNTFYNDGTQNEWRLREEQEGWELSGDWNGTSVRSTIHFQNDGGVMKVKWEYSKDGKNWKPFWESTLTRS